MNSKRTGINVLIIILIGIVFYVGLRFGLNQKGDYDNNKFSLEYLNESGHKLELRYKYELSFATSESFQPPKRWDMSDSLFTLFRDGIAIKSITLLDEDRPIIPEVSNVVVLKPGEFTEANFSIDISEGIKDKKGVEDLIRFETKVIVEELRQNQWVPIYQVILMKRGSYWSLDKGPIEYINTIVN